MWTRKVGSSLVNRLRPLEKLGDSLPSGMIASETTGSGTNIEVWSRGRQCVVQSTSYLEEAPTIEYVVLPSLKVSPDEQSTPNMAQISPDPIESMS